MSVPVVPSPQAHAYDDTVPSGSDDVYPSTETTRKCAVYVNAATGGLCVDTVTIFDVEFVKALLSVTVRVIVLSPAVAYVWVAVVPVPVVPSPQAHAYDDTVPSGSDDVDPSTETTRKFTVYVNAATGGFGGADTVTIFDVEFVSPLLSVTVRVIVLAPAVAYVWVAVMPVQFVPSPQVHAYDDIVPSRSDDVDPSTRTTRKFTMYVNAATGGFSGADTRATG
jgi:hypothetical protein